MAALGCWFVAHGAVIAALDTIRLSQPKERGRRIQVERRRRIREHAICGMRRVERLPANQAGR
jgi:hypothetical protein